MVEIIPKQIKRLPNLYQIGFYLALGLVLAAGVTVAVLFVLEGKSINKLQSLEDGINQIGTQEERSQETQLLLDKKRIEDFSTLLNNHQKTSAIFKAIEENTLPKVWFTKFDFTSNLVSLSGSAPSFKILGQQLLIFRAHNLIEKTTLSSIAIGKSGDAEFILSLSFKPEIFQ